MDKHGISSSTALSDPVSDCTWFPDRLPSTPLRFSCVVRLRTAKAEISALENGANLGEAGNALRGGSYRFISR